jgi:hypothetical protein
MINDLRITWARYRHFETSKAKLYAQVREQLEKTWACEGALHMEFTYNAKEVFKTGVTSEDFQTIVRAASSDFIEELRRRDPCPVTKTYFLEKYYNLVRYYQPKSYHLPNQMVMFAMIELVLSLTFGAEVSTIAQQARIEANDMRLTFHKALHDTHCAAVSGNQWPAYISEGKE